MVACTNCGDPHDEPGTICGWCLAHIGKELDSDNEANGVREPVGPSDDLSLSEALQWAEQKGVFADV